MRFRELILPASMVLFYYAYSSATTINIPDDYLTIQEGIDSSSNGDTVLVQPGTYWENVSINGKSILLGSLFIMTGDTSYSEITIIDGENLAGVITIDSCSSIQVSGFTLRDGSSSGGGGINCSHSNIVVEHCLLADNRAGIGGGMTVRGGRIRLINNSFIGNDSFDKGGGLFVELADSVSIIDNYFYLNHATNYVEFEGAFGGAVCSENNLNVRIENNIIRENTAYGWGSQGGGMHIYNNANVSISKNIIDRNSANGYETGNGGGISTVSSNVYIMNNTIANNSVSSILYRFGGGIYSIQSERYLVNSIVYANAPNQIYGQISTTYSCIQGGWTGEGNIDSDPMFVDSANGDYHLLSGSPCIDAGDPESPLDPDSTRADMGAFYFDQNVGIEDNVRLPDKFMSYQNYPNPFNALTMIKYELPRQSRVSLEIYDLLGRRVGTLHDGLMPAGQHRILWHARDLSSGIYFYKLQAGGQVETKKMVLIK